MDLHVIAHSRGCQGGNCPTVWQDRMTGRVRLRGANPDDPTTERDIEMSADEWTYLLAQLPR